MHNNISFSNRIKWREHRMMHTSSRISRQVPFTFNERAKKNVYRKLIISFVCCHSRIEMPVAINWHTRYTYITYIPEVSIALIAQNTRHTQYRIHIKHTQTQTQNTYYVDRSSGKTAITIWYFIRPLLSTNDKYFYLILHWFDLNEQNKTILAWYLRARCRWKTTRKNVLAAHTINQ